MIYFACPFFVYTVVINNKLIDQLLEILTINITLKFIIEFVIHVTLLK